MKWFTRLFLLFVVFLLGESGLYAGCPRHGNQYASLKHHHNLANNKRASLHTQQVNDAPPLQFKKEYRKIKGTKDDDDDRKSLNRKKVKGLESNTGKYALSKAYASSTSSHTIGQYSFSLKKTSPSSYRFLRAKSYRLYNLFQMFRI